MTTKVFSTSEALHFGWNTTKSNLGFFIGFLIVAPILPMIPVLFMAFLVILRILPENILISTIFGLICVVLAILVPMGIVKTALRFCDQENGRLSDLFSQYRLFFKHALAYVLYFLILFGGMILLIIPGIIWSIKFWFFDYFVIDKGLGPIEALKQSSAITRGAKWQLLGFFIVMWLINALGALLLLVGLFVTIPTTMLATAFVYRKLLAQTEMAPMSQALPEATV